jgi:uncharacterized protein YukE
LQGWHRAVATDPVALYDYASRNEAAAAALESIVFPVIGSWHGVAGRLFQARIDALAKRRNELKDAHARAAWALRDFAVVAERAQEEMRYQQSERAKNADRRAHIDALLRYTTEPAEILRLRHDHDVCEHNIRTADYGYAKAEKSFTDAERKCANDIGHLAHLREMEPLAERIEKLSVKDFVAYKLLVKSGVVSKEGLNWTADGCSDKGIVTGDVDLAACQLHDFEYRNNDKTRDPYLIDKANADARLHDEMIRNATVNKGVVNLVAAGPLHLATDLARAGGVYLGVQVGGWPNANMTDDRLTKEEKKEEEEKANKKKTKSRDK